MFNNDKIVQVAVKSLTEMMELQFQQYLDLMLETVAKEKDYDKLNEIFKRFQGDLYNQLSSASQRLAVEVLAPVMTVKDQLDQVIKLLGVKQELTRSELGADIIFTAVGYLTTIGLDSPNTNKFDATRRKALALQRELVKLQQEAYLEELAEDMKKMFSCK